MYSDDERIGLMIFSLTGHVFAFDVDDISSVIDIEEAEEKGISISYFHERLALRCAAPAKPKVIVGKRRDDGLIIEEPDDIVSVPLLSIKGLPMIYEKCGKHPALLGVMTLGKKTVFLVDIDAI